jgi:hypothetical protein
MDRAELKISLKPFQDRCAEKGRPVVDFCLEEAFPGDISTSYIIQVKAPWVDETYCSEALDFLFDTLWETTEEELRKKIFSILILDSRDQLHCWQEAATAKHEISK